MIRTKEAVIKCLVEKPETRNNDNLLIAEVLYLKFGTYDMKEIAKLTSVGICGSIIRLRAKIQNELNPNLQAYESVRVARNERATRIKKEMRGL